MKRAPINTERQLKERPSMLSWKMGGAPNKILAQESEGQRSLIGSDTLPTDMGRSDYDSKVILEAAGVKFLGVVEDDDLFQYVELPQGWKRVATDRSMWSDLVDDKGRKRARIFYKAAFYDRRAFMSLSSRFSLTFDFDLFDKENVGIATVLDGEIIIHSTEPISADGKKSYEISEKAKEAATAWLNQSYPDWRNPGAYWD